MSSSESAAVGRPPEHRTSLANRYGRPKRRLSKPLLITIVAVALVVALAVVYFLSRNQQQSYDTQNVSFDVVDSRRTDVTVAVKLPEDETVTCGVQVLSDDHAVVGYKEAVFSGKDGQHAGGSMTAVQRTVKVRTVFTGVTGQVSICWKN
jgi:hypothetical protein